MHNGEGKVSWNTMQHVNHVFQSFIRVHSLKTFSIIIHTIDTFIQQGCNKVFQSDSQDIYNITKDFCSDFGVILIFLFNQSILKKSSSSHKNIKQHNCSQH